ncbi:MAG: M1 family aminopeptidase, partial [Myxococcota bacterium]|nr:M1 family aminopeptidase [Myxococcota bacterium]
MDIDLAFDLEAREAAGTVTITVQARTSGEQDLELDALDFLDLAVVDADDQVLDWEYDGSKLRVRWSQAPEPGEQRRVAITYRVADPVTGMLFSWPDEHQPDRPRFLVTDHETERARYWLPCIDHPSVRTTLDFHLRAGAEYTILANGAELGCEDHEDGTKTVHWKLDHPCSSYLVCLAVGDFLRVEGGEHAGVPIAFFTTPNFSPADLERSFAPTRSMLEWMTAKLDAPFPFPKYFQLALPGIGGAMENISLVTWDDKFVADEGFHGERGWLIDIINLHEMAHSYFGDAVVARDFAHVWLKESWATYMESCWLEDTQGEEALHWQLSEESLAYRREADGRYVRPIVTREFDASWDMYDQHLYPGGAFRLHMLRQALGDEDFWGGVQDYVRAFSGEVVETADFRRSLEARSGRSLAQFFDQWIHSPGYPRLKARFSYDSDRKEAVLKVEQTQVDSKKGVGLFVVQVEVDFETADGEWVHSCLELSEAKQALVMPLEKRPRQILIDPRGKLLHSLEFEHGRQPLVRSILEAPTVPGRIQAARSLGTQALRQSVDALIGAYASEQHWGVRIEIIRSLASVGSQAACEGLAALLPSESDPRVFGELAKACGKYRDPVIASALVAWLDEDRLGPMARGEALASLGRQRGEEQIERLKAEAEAEGWWGWARRGALTGLGQTRTDDARQYLATRVAPAADLLQVRIAAVEALAEAGRWQERGARQETLELLEVLSRDPEYDLRRAVSRGLRRLGMSGAVPVLESLARSLAAQDRPQIQRSVRALRRQLKAGGTVPALRKQVEELTEALRKVQSRVDLLEARSESE